MEIVHLRPDGTYDLSQGTQRPEWPGLVDTKLGGSQQAFSLIQNPVVQIAKAWFRWRPQRAFGSWAGFMASDAPAPDLSSDHALLVAFANHPYPVAPTPPYDNAELRLLGYAFGEEVEHAARNQASTEAAGAWAKKAALFAFASTVFVIAVIVGIWVLSLRFGVGAA